MILAAALTGCRSPARAPRLTHSTPIAAQATLLAGVGVVDVTPDKGYPLAGFGGGARRQSFPLLFGVGLIGRLSLDLSQRWSDGYDDRSHYLSGAAGTSDPLYAKAIALIPKGEPPLVLCRLDLVIMTAALQDRVLELTKDLGLRRDRFFLCATHTHSGVGAFHKETLPKLIALDNYRPEIFEKLAQGAALAIRKAIRGAKPSSLAVAKAVDPPGAESVARNRRARRVLTTKRNDKDDEILALVIRQGSRITSVLVNYAVHPTVLGMDNAYWSGDVAAGIEGAVSDALPDRPPVLFFNGAEGDIAPVRGGLRHRGGIVACRLIGERLARYLTPAIRASKGAAKLAIGSVASERDFGTPHAIISPWPEAFSATEKDPASLVSSILALPLNIPFWLLLAPEIRVVFTWNGRLGVIAVLSPYSNGDNRYRIGAVRLQVGSEELCFSSIPGEATHDLGLAIKLAAKSRGARHAFVFGLANGAMSYIASRKVYYEGSYEAMATLFGPETGPRLLESVEFCLDRLYPTASPAKRRSSR